MPSATIVYAGEQKPNTTSEGKIDMDLSALASELGLPANATESQVVGVIRGNHARAKSGLAADIRNEATQQRALTELLPMVGELAVGKLDAGTASPGDIQRVVGEIISSEAYRSAAASSRSMTGVGKTINPAVPRPTSTSAGGVDMSVFGTSTYRLDP
jgi:hypothetical protein